MNAEIITKILLMIFVPFIVVVAIIPYIKKIASDIKAVDNHIGGRHIHKKPIPKLGGLAIFFGFLTGYIFFGIHSVTMNAVLIGSFIILIVGVIDDITELSAKTQFIAQLIAACVIVFYGNLLIRDVSAFGIYLLRNAREQATQGQVVKSLAESQPGDLVFFDHADRDPNATRITHVGMLISPTEVIHCAGWVHVAKIEDMGIRLANGKLSHHLAQIKRYL